MAANVCSMHTCVQGASNLLYCASCLSCSVSVEIVICTVQVDHGIKTKKHCCNNGKEIRSTEEDWYRWAIGRDCCRLYCQNVSYVHWASYITRDPSEQSEPCKAEG